MLRNDEIGWAALAARLEAGEWDNVVISPGPGTPHNKSDIGQRHPPPPPPTHTHPF